MDIKEPCPKCGTMHERGEYMYYGDGTGRIGPYDVKCQCGLTLHWSVPLFKVTRSGYVLRVLRDDETPHFPKEG